jgi:hypothetical protein
MPFELFDSRDYGPNSPDQSEQVLYSIHTIGYRYRLKRRNEKRTKTL